MSTNNMATDRNSLIDYIDEYYNNEDGRDLLSSTMISMFGDKVLDEQGEIDDEGDEGIYTYSQLSTLKQALSDFSDVTFTKDRQMSKDATLILRQLEE